MILNTYQILDLINKGVIENATPSNVNGSSLDLTLGKYILVEKMSEAHKFSGLNNIISLRQKDSLCMEKVDLEKDGHFILRPGQFILAETVEKFNIPLNISAEYKLKSSMARIGLEHLNAGWVDPGWNNSVLTLEFRNLTTFHEIELVYGDKIGQMVFFQHEPVEMDDSYAIKGRYNGLAEVSGPITDRKRIESNCDKESDSKPCKDSQ